VTWYRKSADQGYPGGQYNLGWMYQHGLGVPEDYVQAATLYRKAAEQGFANAQNQLGMLYKDGNGVPRDDEKAATWFRKAADQGYSAAELNLGWMYANGRGVAQDYEQALSWYRKAAAQGADVQAYLDDLPSGVRDQAEQLASTSNLPGEATPALLAPAASTVSQDAFAHTLATPAGMKGNESTREESVLTSSRPIGSAPASPASASLQNELQNLRSAEISGKVFLITQGGDLKLARFAQVILLYGGVLGGSQDTGTASIFYYRKKGENLKASWPSPSHPTSCQTDLLVFNSSLKSTLEWGQTTGKATAQIQVTTSDEEGTFQFRQVPVGEYTVIAWGRAGFNDAHWEESLKVQPGQSVAMKLSSPHVACVD